MLLIPAIDLKNNKCVRLRQGDINRVTVFDKKSPEMMARNWIELGASRLHIVDLNGAFLDKKKNYKIIKNIVDEVNGDVPIQIGGGIRNFETVEYYLNIGINYVIVSTSIIKDTELLFRICSVFKNNIIAGIDVINKKVAINGWNKITNYNDIDIAMRVEDFGCNSIIYTDISKDGMLSGLNIFDTIRLSRFVNIPVIISGGLSSIDDIRLICENKSNIYGIICGRSVYDGNIDFLLAKKYINSCSFF